jgi:hypothetical protein
MDVDTTIDHTAKDVRIEIGSTLDEAASNGNDNPKEFFKNRGASENLFYFMRLMNNVSYFIVNAILLVNNMSFAKTPSHSLLYLYHIVIN